MKTFFKSVTKCFSVKKYIKPLHNQQYYNNKHAIGFKDKVSILSLYILYTIFTIGKA
jgi:hypothetical protein